MSRNKAARTQIKLDRLLAVCNRPGRILVLTQNSPDPDALASAAALRELFHVSLNKRADIAYGGAFTRAENRTMVQLLSINARHIDLERLRRYDIICLVDTQPRTGNNILPPARQADVVIDHHILPPNRIWTAPHTDVRPAYGASTTILYEYVRAAKLPISQSLATAMFYGIQSDTQDLGRESGPADIQAYRELFLIADKRKLARIHRAPVPAEYFQMLADSLATCIVAGSAVISRIQTCHHPEMIAEVADLLIRLEKTRTAVCYGICGKNVFLSVRATSVQGNAAKKMLRVVRGIGTGGGHRMMAGGQIPLGDCPKARIDLINERLLQVFAPGKQPIPLTSPGHTTPCIT